MSEYVPDPYALTLLGLAAFRIWKLIADDTILDRPRRWVLAKFGPVQSKRWEYWHLFVTCPWCAGFWITFVLWTWWLRYPDQTLVFCGLWALSAIVGLLASAHDKLVT